MPRTILMHLNVAVPDDDPRDAEQIGVVLMGALEVGIDPNDPSLAALGVEAVLVEEVEAARRYLDVRYDVTDLDDEQADQLALEALAQAEGSHGHPSVQVEIETTVGAEPKMVDDETVARLQRAILRADVLFRSYVAADDTTRANGSDSREDLLVAELVSALVEYGRRPPGMVANVLLDGEASEHFANTLLAERLARNGAGIREEPVGGRPVLWFDPYLALYDPHDPDDEPLFFMYGDDEGGTVLAPDVADVAELERRLVRFFGDSGWTIDDHGEIAP